MTLNDNHSCVCGALSIIWQPLLVLIQCFISSITESLKERDCVLNASFFVYQAHVLRPSMNYWYAIRQRSKRMASELKPRPNNIALTIHLSISFILKEPRIKWIYPVQRVINIIKIGWCGSKFDYPFLYSYFLTWIYWATYILFYFITVAGQT